jgi:hypothetical protein
MDLPAFPMQDAGASDLAGYERALDLWQISGAQKATAKLIEGMDIRVQGDQFSVSAGWLLAPLLHGAW